MQLTLTNFEGLIEPKIIERGYDYYKRGRIRKVEKTGENEFTAIAFGSDDYEVYVKVEGEKIVESECDCPYDWGNICKHEVAVYYQIRYGNFTEVNDKTSEILKNLSSEDLLRFVSNLLKRDRNFRRKFLREFDESFYEDDEESEEDYY